MYSVIRSILIRSILVSAALAPMVSAGQVAIPSPAGAPRGGAAHHRKATLVPPPEIVEALPMPLAPLTPGTMPAQPPRVTYRGGVLTVDSQNSTLSDILMAIHQLTGAEFDPMPRVSERAAVYLSGSPNDVVSDLLRGSQFGYVLISSPDDPAILRKVFLTSTEPASAAHPAQMRTTTAFAEPTLAAESVIAPASNESATPIAESAASAALPSKEIASVPPALAEGLQAPPQQPIALPDPAQVLMRANQQNHDQSQPQVSAAGQYMQELYRLRLQQQSQTSQPSASPSLQ